jgi:hypothetical protein
MWWWLSSPPWEVRVDVPHGAVRRKSYQLLGMVSKEHTG